MGRALVNLFAVAVALAMVQAGGARCDVGSVQRKANPGAEDNAAAATMPLDQCDVVVWRVWQGVRYVTSRTTRRWPDTAAGPSQALGGFSVQCSRVQTLPHMIVRCLQPGLRRLCGQPPPTVTGLFDLERACFNPGGWRKEEAAAACIMEWMPGLEGRNVTMPGDGGGRFGRDGMGCPDGQFESTVVAGCKI